MLVERELTRNELGLVWSIDRSEVIDNIYYCENGELVLKQEHYDMKGWPRGEAEMYTPILLDCFDRGGWFLGIFDDDYALPPSPSPKRGAVGPNRCGSDYSPELHSGDVSALRLIAVVVLESKFIGRGNDQLQLKFMHVNSGYRNRGLGKRLFNLARSKAREKRANWLYISATPSENTIRFYLNLGCTVTDSPDADLLALEPNDIHLMCRV